MTMVNLSPLSASIWNLRPTPGRFVSLMVDIMFSFAFQQGSFSFLFESALAELTGVKLSGPLAGINSPLTAVRTSPRRLPDHKGGQHPMWVHSSSMTDHLPLWQTAYSAIRPLGGQSRRSRLHSQGQSHPRRRRNH